MSDRACDELFEAMVESVGIKAFAAGMGLGTRQVHRMLNGTQPNPIARFVEAMKACEGLTAQASVDYVCRAAGGYFVRHLERLDQASVNAVKEAAEAIVAISEGEAPKMEIKEIREAISALAALEHVLLEQTTPKTSTRNVPHTGAATKEA
jgi:hypothetical protein